MVSTKLQVGLYDIGPTSISLHFPKDNCITCAIKQIIKSVLNNEVVIAACMSDNHVFLPY